MVINPNWVVQTNRITALKLNLQQGNFIYRYHGLTSIIHISRKWEKFVYKTCINLELELFLSTFSNVILHKVVRVCLKLMISITTELIGFSILGKLT